MQTQFRWASPRLKRRSDVGDCELWRWQVQLVYWNGGGESGHCREKEDCLPTLIIYESPLEKFKWKGIPLDEAQCEKWPEALRKTREIWNLAELGSQGSAEFYCCRGTNLISRFGSELSADCKQFQQKSRNGEISICIDL